MMISFEIEIQVLDSDTYVHLVEVIFPPMCVFRSGNLQISFEVINFKLSL